MKARDGKCYRGHMTAVLLFLFLMTAAGQTGETGETAGQTGDAVRPGW